jgi:hypothetical protein
MSESRSDSTYFQAVKEPVEAEGKNEKRKIAQWNAAEGLLWLKKERACLNIELRQKPRM